MGAIAPIYSIAYMYLVPLLYSTILQILLYTNIFGKHLVAFGVMYAIHEKFVYKNMNLYPNGNADVLIWRWP